MTVSTRLFTWLFGDLVGRDPAGNRYYRSKRYARGTRERRWVMYAGKREASTVPPDWHGWLHHTVEMAPTEGGPPVRAWQKDHVPNLTGTPGAYRPPGHVLSGGRRDRATGDYEPWRPA